MKLIIEKWLDTQTLPLTAEPLLADAITCYKSGAYRASMLMSYLGFLMTIKDRVMNGDRPAMLPLHKWNEKRTLLQNEDKWEAEINSALQKKEEFTGSGASKTKTEDPFFYISEGLRQQLTYWKDRRNDCAHNKENIIIGAHIEAFWAFMISNLPKITLQGGMATLLQKLTSYYDPTQTPSGTPLMPILELISSSVETSKLDEFWNEAFTVIDQTGDLFFERQNQFIFQALKLNDENVKQSLLSYIKANEPVMLTYMGEHPEILQLLNLTAPETRQLWKTKVGTRNNYLKIFASMLRNKLIPDTEVAEAITLFVSKKEFVNDPVDRQALIDNGYDKALYKKLFVDPNREYYKVWEEINSFSDTYRQYIEFMPLTKEVVEFVCTELAKSYNPYFLAQTLEDLFTKNMVKKQEFKDIAAAEGITLPSNLPSLA